VPLFGEKKDPANEEDWFAAAQPMIEWASSVPRVDLAVEVMAVFGSVDSIGAREIYASMFGGRRRFRCCVGIPTFSGRSNGWRYRYGRPYSC
jgi:hypothetical protein